MTLTSAPRRALGPFQVSPLGLGCTCQLSAATLPRIDAIVNTNTVSDARYNDATPPDIDTEDFTTA